MEYNDFVLRIAPASEPSQFVVTARSATAGEASGTFTAPFSDTELENFILKIGLTRRGVRRIQSPEWRAAQSFGEKLHTQLFSGDIRATFLASRNDALREGKGLRVKFIVDAPALANYPWEFLYDTSLNRFLSLYEATPLVRYVELPVPPRVLRVAPPLRALVIAASPRDYPPLDLAREKNNLDSALADLVGENQIAVDWLPDASLNALRDQLLKRPYHIFHFIGHGGFDETTTDGVLVFEDETKHSRMASGERLAYLLGNHPSLQLAVLNACEGARTSVQDPFAGTAVTLVRSGGVSAVVAMQFEITDEASIAFSRGFYGGVASGKPVDAAVTQARLAVFAQDNDIEWATPVLYLRAPDGVIFVPLSPEEIARARAEQERRERDRQETERMAREQAETERLAREKSERERAAREQADRERLARELMEQETLARAKADSESLARERAEQERVSKVAGLYRTAQQQFAKKNYSDALNTLGSLLALDPANSAAPDLRTKIEAARAEQERLAKEQVERNRAAQIANLLGSAQSNYARRNYRAALEAAGKVLALDPNHAEAQELLRNAQQQLEAPGAHIGIIRRLLGVMTFKALTYREIAKDPKAFSQAATIVVLVAIVGAFVQAFLAWMVPTLRASGSLYPIRSAIQTFVTLIVGWLIGSGVFAFVSRGFFDGKTNTGEMLRVFGFTQIFNVLSIIPIIGQVAGSTLTVIGMILGIREASELSNVKAILSCLIGFLILLIVLAATGAITDSLLRAMGL